MKKEVSVSEFKAKALGLLERVASQGSSFIVTKRGKPIARVVPFQDEKEKPTPDRLSGTVVFEGDIVSPLGAKLWKAAEPDSK